jgi:hypothetical protein
MSWRRSRHLCKYNWTACPAFFGLEGPSCLAQRAGEWLTMVQRRRPADSRSSFHVPTAMATEPRFVYKRRYASREQGVARWCLVSLGETLRCNARAMFQASSESLNGGEAFLVSRYRVRTPLGTAGSLSTHISHQCLCCCARPACHHRRYQVHPLARDCHSGPHASGDTTAYGAKPAVWKRT